MAYKVYAPYAQDRELSRIRTFKTKEGMLKRVGLLRSNGHAALVLRGFDSWTFNKPVSSVFA